MRASRMITSVEVHAEGEPGRVITGGLPPIPGNSVFEKMQWLAAEGDHIRKLHLILSEHLSLIGEGRKWLCDAPERHARGVLGGRVLRERLEGRLQHLPQKHARWRSSRRGFARKGHPT